MSRAETKLLALFAVGAVVIGGAAWLAAPEAIPGPLASVVAIVLVAAVAWWGVPVIGGAAEGIVEGVRDGWAGRSPEPASVDRLAGLSINDVRARADEHGARAVTERQAGRKTWRGYAGTAAAWSKLESAMREQGAWHVADLGPTAAMDWARRLGMARDDRPWNVERRAWTHSTPNVRSEASPPSPVDPEGTEIRRPALRSRGRGRPRI